GRAGGGQGRAAPAAAHGPPSRLRSGRGRTAAVVPAELAAPPVALRDQVGDESFGDRNSLVCRATGIPALPRHGMTLGAQAAFFWGSLPREDPALFRGCHRREHLAERPREALGPIGLHLAVARALQRADRIRELREPSPVL